MTFLLALACVLAIEGPGVSGQVIDAESKQPVAGAVIRLTTETPRQGRLEFECTTDEGGSFRLDLPRAGTYLMGIEGPEGYLIPNERLPEAAMSAIRLGESLEDLGEQPIWPVGLQDIPPFGTVELAVSSETFPGLVPELQDDQRLLQNVLVRWKGPGHALRLSTRIERQRPGNLENRVHLIEEGLRVTP